MQPPDAFLLNSGFRILTLSSHVIPRGIRLPFELVCHRHTDDACYYSNSHEFAGKEGLSLWHTSCPLKRPTERWLCGPYFQSLPLMPVREEVARVWSLSTIYKLSKITSIPIISFEIVLWSKHFIKSLDEMKPIQCLCHFSDLCAVLMFAYDRQLNPIHNWLSGRELSPWWSLHYKYLHCPGK